MNDLSFLKDFVIIFGAAIGINFLFHRLHIAPIVGYLMAGVLLGPSMLGVIKEIALIEVLAQVGVILLLFLIGIEFSLEELIRIKRAVFVGGFLQVFLTTAAVLLISLSAGISIEKGIFILSVIPRSSAATGTNHMRTATSVEHDSHEMPRSSAAIGSFTGILVAMSSTAIVFKVLSDRGEMDSPQGRLSSGILIFQDLDGAFCGNCYFGCFCHAKDRGTFPKA